MSFSKFAEKEGPVCPIVLAETTFFLARGLKNQPTAIKRDVGIDGREAQLKTSGTT
ncbi:MAG: hypothetical protein WB014_09350 [Methanosarcina sp.]